MSLERRVTRLEAGPLPEDVLRELRGQEWFDRLREELVRNVVTILATMPEDLARQVAGRIPAFLAEEGLMPDQPAEEGGGIQTLVWAVVDLSSEGAPVRARYRGPLAMPAAVCRVHLEDGRARRWPDFSCHGCEYQPPITLHSGAGGCRPQIYFPYCPVCGGDARARFSR